MPEVRKDIMLAGYSAGKDTHIGQDSPMHERLRDNGPDWGHNDIVPIIISPIPGLIYTVPVSV